MLPAASVCHAVPGRVRVRVPGMRGNEAWFRSVCADLAGRPEFSVVSGNERTGTILLKGRDLEPASLAELARGEGWFDLRSGRSGGASYSPGSRLVGPMLLLALVQTLRGQVMVPAVGFLWYAIELMREERGDGG